MDHFKVMDSNFHSETIEKHEPLVEKHNVHYNQQSTELTVVLTLSHI